MNKIKSLIKFAEGKTFSYCDHSEKEQLHKLGKAALKELAKALGLSNFDVRSNKAGIACSGEVTLHDERFYLQISPSSCCPPVLLRSCEGRKDYTGGRNMFYKLSEISEPHFIEQIKRFLV